MVTPTSPGTLKGNAIALIQGREPVSIRLALITLCLVGHFFFNVARNCQTYNYCFGQVVTQGIPIETVLACK